MANKAVFGIYSTRRQVENAVDELKAAGFMYLPFGSALATLSTIARRWVSRSPARARTPCQSTNDLDRAMAVIRLRTSFASSPGLCAPANSNLRRRLAAALPALISISSSANRSAPSGSRFFALRVVFAATVLTSAP